jgi:adenosylcobinamide kinase/adenosylcobinamide-phosphate guanylyltransferase
MLDLTLITGGIRSGKSELAERLAREAGERVAYLATGVAIDDEMRTRIDQHRRRRPRGWITLEASEGRMTALLESHLGNVQAVLLDDLGGLAAQLVMRTATVEEADDLMAREEQAFKALVHTARVPSIVVTSEVGLALVPTTDLGRRFADVLGRANQRWASAASNVTVVIAGLPLRLK